MTEDTGTVLGSGWSDAHDRLLSAEEPLAGLQVRCGGTLPGVIAVPELLELVRKARTSGLSLSRSVRAHDGSDEVRAWVDVEPDAKEGQGCIIRVRTWQAAVPLAEEGVLAEEQRRTAIDRHVAELCAYLDADQKVLAVTCDMPELAGVASAMASGAGQLWTEFLEPENVAHQQPLHWRLLDGAKVSVAGSTRAWRVALIPHLLPGFDPVGFELLLLSDEPAPRKPDLQISEAPAPRPSLVGQDLAPVLKQPIARIIANAETIRTRLAGPLPDAYAEYAGEIASAGTLLLGLLEDMADLEMVESDEFSTMPEPIDLAEVAQQAAGILGVRAQEKGITIVSPDKAIPLWASAEFRRVLQVLLNLIGNALRYSPAHSQITLSLEQSGTFARVIVADEGPGIRRKDQSRIFDRFERLGRSGDGGSGLGLYISRRLARAMSGDLTVESEEGHGARFILTLPLGNGAA